MDEDARHQASVQLRRDLHRIAMQGVRQIWPHAYWPSATHMGDCQVCGHMQGDEVHRVRSTPADPAPQVPFSEG